MRDLSSLPPEMASLDASIKAAQKRLSAIDIGLGQAKARFEDAENEQQQAVKAEAAARKDLKASTHKVQYTAAMRSLEEKERLIETSVRTQKEAEAALMSLKEEREGLLGSQNENQLQFDELNQIFLSEHENQVVGKARLTAKIAELEGLLDKATLNKFNRLMQGRNGRAVVPTENDTCTGCHTKLRAPLVYKLKAEKCITCESCQRILYLPDQALGGK